MKFQLERISLFSDAVFAIVITLMMIEIKAPHLPHDITFGGALTELAGLFPLILGTVLSFFLIGVFWTKHHKLMKYVTGYTPKLIWLNIRFLLCVAFIPFSTAFVFENFEAHSPLPLLVYNINYIVATIFEYRLFNYALNPQNGICATDTDYSGEWNKKEALFPIVVYVLVAVLAFFTPLAAMGYAAFALEKVFVGTKKKLSGVE
jgi:uncharacterized membrane protein